MKSWNAEGICADKNNQREYDRLTYAIEAAKRNVERAASRGRKDDEEKYLAAWAHLLLRSELLLGAPLRIAGNYAISHRDALRAHLNMQETELTGE